MYYRLRALGALEEGEVEIQNPIFYLRFEKKNLKKNLGGGGESW